MEIGEVFTSNYGQKYKVVRFLYKEKNLTRKVRMVEIEFLETGFKTITMPINVKRGKVKDWSLLPKIEDFQNKILKTNSGLEYVLLNTEPIIHESSRQKYYPIKFIKSGSIKEVRLEYIINGKIHDDYAPSVAGIGYLGKASRANQPRKYYDLWRNMIHRCYNPKRHDYGRYGGKGITVCERWHCFEYFLEDIALIDGWNKEKFENSKIQLDKDKKQFNIPHNQRVYSKDTCEWLSPEDNYMYRKERGN